MKKYFKYFYSWPASVVAANFAAIFDSLFFSSPLSFLASFMLWPALSLLLTIIFILVFERKSTSKNYLLLFLGNVSTWIGSIFLLIFLYLLIPIGWEVIILFPVLVVTGFFNY